VTSRRQLAGLAATHGAHLLSLDVLPAAEARDLLAARLGDARAAREPEAIGRLAEQCSRLPLALSIAAALAAGRPGLSLTALVTELQDEHRRLEVLNAGDATASVRAVFSWSHDRLSDPAARMFRLLGLHPGPDLTIPAAASMAGTSRDDARRLMAELTDGNLLAEHMPGRFAFHDLMHAYAGDQARRQDDATESRAAVQRALDFYLQTARAADRLLNPAREPASLMIPAQPGAVPERIDGVPRALAWLSAEHSVLVAAVQWAADARFDLHARELAAAMVTYLDQQGHLRDYALTQVTALAAAQRAGDLPGRAQAHLDLAGALGRLGEHDRARDNFWRALALFQDLGDCGGQGRARLSLGWLLNEIGEHAQALAHCQDALELFRASGEPVWQARALGAVGWCDTLLGDHARALVVCQEAVGLHRELGDNLGEAAAWESLGDARHHLGQHHEAVASFRRSAALYAGLGEHYYNAEALTRLGDSCQAAGDPHAARDAWQEALAVLEDHHLPNTAELRAKLMDVGRAAAGAEARGRSVRLDQ
jgi:tetratricopeptide (TPR) repeat protein